MSPIGGRGLTPNCTERFIGLNIFKGEKLRFNLMKEYKKEGFTPLFKFVEFFYQVLLDK